MPLLTDWQAVNGSGSLHVELASVASVEAYLSLAETTVDGLETSGV